MSGTLKFLGWALLVLALAYPHAAGMVLAVVGVVGGLVLGNFAVLCVTVAVLLLARVALRIYRHHRMRRLRRLLLGTRW
jgi:hypothetical protein